MIGRLLRKNTSGGRILGFAVSNLIGLVIMAVGLQFFLDARSIWEEKDSFLKSDYLVVNKIVDASTTLGKASAEFTDTDIAELSAQPWVDKVGKFTRADFRVYASMALGGDNSGGMSTAMFFESVPDDFLDFNKSDFSWTPRSKTLPMVISKDYLALYNFGFAGAAGLPQLSEGVVSGIPLKLTLSSNSGVGVTQMYGNIVDYSNRFNTILVPQSFLDAMNTKLGSGEVQAPSRLIVDVNSPGDAAIAPWLKERGWEIAGDKSASSAAYLLRVVSSIVIAIGSVITLLSLFILVLSMSLLMEKNKRKLHSLLMLGYPIKAIAKPYRLMTAAMSIGAAAAAIACVIAMRSFYLAPLTSLGAQATSPLWSILLILIFTTLIIVVNCAAVQRRIISNFRG